MNWNFPRSANLCTVELLTFLSLEAPELIRPSWHDLYIVITSTKEKERHRTSSTKKTFSLWKHQQSISPGWPFRSWGPRPFLGTSSSKAFGLENESWEKVHFEKLPSTLGSTLIIMDSYHFISTMSHLFWLCQKQVDPQHEYHPLSVF